MSLQGKVALVSGASQGIGREIALSLARAGVRVKALARGAAGLDETKSLAEDAPGSVEPVICDLTDAQQVATVVETLLGETGKVDFLINNAGVTRDGLLIRMKEEDWSWPPTNKNRPVRGPCREVRCPDSRLGLRCYRRKACLYPRRGPNCREINGYAMG